MTVPRGQLWDYPLFGLPYNGLATNEQITLANGHSVAYAFSGNQSVLVRGRDRGRRQPQNSVQQAWMRQMGYRFRDYALLTGEAREIGGVALGKESWIYCDRSHAWHVRLAIDVVSGTNQVRIKLILVNVFGLLAWNTIPPTMAEERILAQIVFPLRYRFVEARPSSALCDVVPFLTHSEHGDYTAINLCASLDEVGDCDFQTPEFNCMFYGRGYDSGYQTHTVLTATISGDGSIASGAVGDGIVGRLDLIAQGGDLVQGTTVGAFTGYTKWLVFAAVNPAGNLVWAEWEYYYDIGYMRQIARFAGAEVEAVANAGAVVNATVSHMISPGVFALTVSAGSVPSQRIIAAADGSQLGGYFDTAGDFARMVSYNPGTGKFAVAPTSSDVVQWV